MATPESSDNNNSLLINQRIGALEKRLDDSRSYLNIIVAALSGVLATAAVTGGVWGIIFRQDWSDHTTRIEDLSLKNAEIQAAFPSLVNKEVQRLLEGQAVPKVELLTSDGGALDGASIETEPEAWTKDGRIMFPIRIRNMGGAVREEMIFKYSLDSNLTLAAAEKYLHPSDDKNFPFETGGPYGTDWMGTSRMPGGGFNLSNKLGFNLNKSAGRPTQPIKMKIQIFAGSLKLYEGVTTLLFSRPL
ncbi:MAG: hypothetical protein V4672_08145 [Verrucomicrobiota bacterium]